jgi:hypothetical protein
VSKRITIVAIVTWSTALLAAGAFAYTLSSGSVPQNGSRTPPMLNSVHEIGSLDTVPPPATAAPEATRPPVVLTTTVIMGTRRSAATHRAPAVYAPAPTGMKCTGWRQLEQGSPNQGVRTCE